MGDFMTPKQIAKKLKSRGYGKPHLYCQLCRKQCRDDNGFRCHMESTKHIARVQQFGERQDEFIERFSKEFENGMMNIIKTVFKNQQVPITTVHHHYERARSQTRLNGTRWLSLDEFAAHLGKTGQVQAIEKEHGFDVLYLAKDPEVVAQQEKLLKERRKAERDDKAMEEMMKIQTKREQELLNMQQSGSTTENKPTELNLEDENRVKVSLKLGFGKPKTTTTTTTAAATTSGTIPLQTDNTTTTTTTTTNNATLDNVNNNSTVKVVEQVEFIDSFDSSSKDNKRKSQESENNNKNVKSTQPEPNKKKKVERRANWIEAGIVVKIVSKKVGEGKYYKKKGVIEKVEDLSTALVKLLDTNEEVKVKQEYLETVIPQIGGKVLVVNGKHVGETATMMGINEEKFCVQIKLESGPNVGTTSWEPYEDICKSANK